MANLHERQGLLGIQSHEADSAHASACRIFRASYIPIIIRFNDKGLASLPSDVGRATTLELLSLASNRLTTLPAEIGQLAKLRHLDVSNNHLETLPAQIGQLQTLREFNLADNALKLLPDEFTRMSSLRRLLVGHNALTHLPDAMGDMQALVFIDVSHNSLSRVPSSLSRLAALVHLDLSHNHITEVTGELCRLHTLKILDMSHNQLTTLPDTLSGLPNLATLDVSHNQLTELPESVGTLFALRHLVASSNQLTLLPPTISRLARTLTRLSVDHNRLSTLPPGTGALVRLKTLDIHHNALLRVPTSLANFKSLRSLSLIDVCAPSAVAAFAIPSSSPQESIGVLRLSPSHPIRKVISAMVLNEADARTSAVGKTLSLTKLAAYVRECNAAMHKAVVFHGGAEGEMLPELILLCQVAGGVTTTVGAGATVGEAATAHELRRVRHVCFATMWEMCSGDESSLSEQCHEIVRQLDEAQTVLEQSGRGRAPRRWVDDGQLIMMCAALLLVGSLIAIGALVDVYAMPKGVCQTLQRVAVLAWLGMFATAALSFFAAAQLVTDKNLRNAPIVSPERTLSSSDADVVRSAERWGSFAWVDLWLSVLLAVIVSAVSGAIKLQTCA